ncbi:MAG: hypothetical protein QM770_10070 [Tepidisphaeraceae bacterium]
MTTHYRHVWIDGKWLGCLLLPATVKKPHDWVKDYVRHLGIDPKVKKVIIGVPGSSSPQWYVKSSNVEKPPFDLASEIGPIGLPPK